MDNIEWLSDEDLRILDESSDLFSGWDLPLTVPDTAGVGSSSGSSSQGFPAGQGSSVAAPPPMISNGDGYRQFQPKGSKEGPKNKIKLTPEPNPDPASKYKYAESEVLSEYISREVVPDVDFSVLSTVRFDMSLAPLDKRDYEREIAEEAFFLLRLHHQRLEYTLKFFGWDVEVPYEVLLAQVRAAVQGLDMAQAYKLRVLVRQAGELAVEASAVPARRNLYSGLTRDDPGPEYVVFLDREASMVGPYTSFKTTHRPVYTAARARSLVAPGPNAPLHQEVLMYNPRNEVTEGSITNIAVYREGRWVTPPLGVGCLCGVVRHHLLAKKVVQERTVARKSLVDGEPILVFNGVMGVCRGVLRLQGPV